MAYTYEQNIMARTMKMLTTQFHFGKASNRKEQMEQIQNLIDTCPVEVGKKVRTFDQMKKWKKELAKKQWWFNDNLDSVYVTAAYNRTVEHS